MPFIEQWRRDKINRLGLDSLALITPGDRCYVHYKRMVDAWNKEPRWTTAHVLARDAAMESTDPDENTASFLAFLVFFNTHVMPYELKKREENGDI